MKPSDYNASCDVIGATSAPSAPDRAIVIRPRDVGATVRAKGGAAGTLAYALIPETVSNQFYEQFSAQLRDGLKQQGVEADVYVAAVPPAQAGPTKSDFVGGAAVGAGGAAAIYGVVRLIQHLIRRR
jgi:hypothetical protein